MKISNRKMKHHAITHKKTPYIAKWIHTKLYIMTCKKTTDKKKQNKTIDIQLWFKEKYYNFHSYLQYTEEQMKLLNYKIITPFKKPSARKSFAPLLNAHPLKAIISSKSSPLLIVFQPLEVSKSLKVRQKRCQMLNTQSDV